MEDLSFDTEWVVYALVGWAGGSQHTRRRGKGGSYSTVELIAPLLHDCKPPYDDVGLVKVSDVENMWSGELDRQGLALFAIGLNIEIALDPDVDPSKLDDFLRAHLAWDIPGAGGNPDVQNTITLPQEESA